MSWDSGFRVRGAFSERCVPYLQMFRSGRQELSQLQGQTGTTWESVCWACARACHTPVSEATAPSKVLVHEAILQGPGLAAGGLDPEGLTPALGAELGCLGDSCSWSTPRGLRFLK